MFFGKQMIPGMQFRAAFQVQLLHFTENAPRNHQEMYPQLEKSNHNWHTGHLPRHTRDETMPRSQKDEQETGNIVLCENTDVTNFLPSLANPPSLSTVISIAKFREIERLMCGK
jgi:hypothetical protein